METNKERAVGRQGSRAGRKANRKTGMHEGKYTPENTARKCERAPQAHRGINKTGQTREARGQDSGEETFHMICIVQT